MKKFSKSILGLIVFSFVFFSCKTDPHEHSYSDKWSSNETEHWHEATCEHSSEVSDKAAHTFGEWKVTKDSTEETEGSQERSCSICSYKETKAIEKKDHNHSISTDWSYDSEKHWHAASCGKEEHNEDISDHEWNHTEYEYDAKFGKNIRICTVCSYVDIKDHVHTEDSGKVTTEPDCVTKGVRTYMCTVCNAVARTEDVDAKGHNKEWVIIKEASTSAVGIMGHKCKNCNEIFRKELYCGPSEVSEEKVEYKDYYENTINTSFYYIYFGVFPKSAKASSVTVDADEIITMGGNTYYHGSDDEWYAKLDTKYFKVEPIKWKVLTTDYAETGKVLLLSEYVLNSNVPFYFNPGAGQRIINGKTIYDNNYKYSTIRAYLNGKYENYDTQSTDYKDKGFLQTAFGTSSQTLIIETEVNNGYKTTGYGDINNSDYTNTYTSTYACDNTNDKVFLLSRSELYNVYGFSNEDDGYARIRKETDYAKANNYQSGWWTRSPSGVDDYDAHYVSDWGSIGSINTVYTYWYGVVPAMWINFQ